MTKHDSYTVNSQIARLSASSIVITVDKLVGKR